MFPLLNLKHAVYVLAGASAFLSHASNAGTFGVSPVRVPLSIHHQTDVVNITNYQNEAVVVQVDVLQWSQNDKGEDVFTPTQEVIASPPILKIEPNEVHAVRVGFMAGQDFNQEKSYRLFFQEISTNATQVAGMNMVLRIGIPVFVAPKNKTSSQLTWRIQQDKDKTLKLSASNVGNQHLQILSLDAGINQQNILSIPKVLAYLLPNTTKNWSVAFNKNIKGQKLHVKAKINDSQNSIVEVDVVVD